MATINLQSRAVGSVGVTNASVGSLISFDYMFYQHDPRPLLLVSRVRQAGTNPGGSLISGFNLHYMTFSFIRAMLRGYALSPIETHRAALRNSVTSRSYRSYSIKGIMRARRIDWRGFIQRMSIVRQMRPDERQALIDTVQEQLASRRSSDLTNINKIIADRLSRIQVTPTHGNVTNVANAPTPGTIQPGEAQPVAPTSSASVGDSSTT